MAFRRFSRRRRYARRMRRYGRGKRSSWVRRRGAMRMRRIANRAAAIVASRMTEKTYWVYRAEGVVFNFTGTSTTGMAMNFMDSQFSGGATATCNRISGRRASLRGGVLELKFEWKGGNPEQHLSFEREYPDSIRIMLLKPKQGVPAAMNQWAQEFTIRDEAGAETAILDTIRVTQQRYYNILYDRRIHIGYPRPRVELPATAGSTTLISEPLFYYNPKQWKKSFRFRWPMIFDDADYTSGVLNPNSTPNADNCLICLLVSEFVEFDTGEEDWSYIFADVRWTGFYTDMQ